MASPYQQQVFQRKLIYLGLVVFLLGASLLWRRYVVEARARELALLEETKGEVHLVDSAIRLGLFGSRGLVTCVLWMSAIERQKKNQWGELELYVDSLTTLQPHFITPWLFQSWNLAYNVSVESDRVRDKYFYVSRGIQLLANGERQNRFNPDLRRDIGFYHQHKICQSDESNTMRSLFQLSCIAPKDRNPEDFRDDKGEIKWEFFKKFCQDHPQLVRRLHSPPLPYDPRHEYPKFRCTTAQEVVQFLEDNHNIPSLFIQKEDDLEAWRKGAIIPVENDLRRFPVLPRDRAPDERDRVFDHEEWTEEKLAQTVGSTELDGFDAYQVARAWYGYSQEAVPPPGDIPGESQQPRDRRRERLPKHMASAIFRSSPARAQTYVAERLEEEGWFDREPFTITGWFQREGGDQSIQVGGGHEWAQNAWEKASRMWDEYGRRNHLWFENEADKQNMIDRANAFRTKFNLRPYDRAPQINEQLLNEEDRKNLHALRFLGDFDTTRQITNFPSFQMRARVEGKPKTIQARKRFYQAEHLRLVARKLEQALQKYEDPQGLQAWREVLEENPEYRADSFIQEQAYEVQLKYLRLWGEGGDQRTSAFLEHRDNLVRDLALEAFLGQAISPAPLGADWALLGSYAQSKALLPRVAIDGPFDKDSKGQPFVPQQIRDLVKQRRGLAQPPADAAAKGQKPAP
jgi:hypothetical protein